MLGWMKPKIAGRNINNLRYADDTTVMAKNERREWKSWLKTQHSEKTKIMASSPITSWETDGATMETVTDFISGGSKITADG